MSNTNHDSCWGTIVGDNTNIDCDVVRQACESWNQGNNSLNAAFQEMQGNPFQAMTNFNPTIGATYIEELKNSMEELLIESQKMSVAVSNYAGITSQEDNDDPWTGGGGYSGGGGGYSGGGGSSGNDSPQTPSTPASVEKAQKIVDAIDTTSLEKLDLSALDNFVEILRDMSGKEGKGIDEILADDKYNDEIKKRLLESQYIPDELKKILTENDSIVSRLLLNDIMSGKRLDIFELNSVNLDVMYEYLNKVATENNITFSDFISKEQHTDLLKNTLSQLEDCKNVIRSWDNLSVEDYQTKLLNVYDGDGIGDMKENTVGVLRTFVKYLEDKSGVSSEEMLTQTKYADTIKSAVQEFGKSTIFASTLPKYSNSGISSVLGKNLFTEKFISEHQK